MSRSGLGPIYSAPPFVQRGHGIGSFLSGVFRLVLPVLWSGVKTIGRETLRNGRKFLSYLADITAGDVKPRHIIAKHVGDSAHALIQKLRGRGRKRAADLMSRELPPKIRQVLRWQRLPKEISLYRTYHSITDHGCGRTVGKHCV